MPREFLASAASALAPLAVLALAAFGGWASSLVARHMKDRRYALAVELAAYGAAAIVADLAQSVVGNLKDPSKPGTWNHATAASLRLRAVARVRELYPNAVRTIAGVLRDPARVDELLGTLVERAVIDTKRTSSTVAVSEALVTDDALLPADGSTPAVTSVHTVTLRVGAPDDPQAGQASPGPMLMTFSAAVIALALLACSSARDAQLNATAGVPTREGCASDAGVAWRCRGDEPQTCEASLGRWWPALAPNPDGSPRRCLAGCAIGAEGHAYCRPAADGGAR